MKKVKFPWNCTDKEQKLANMLADIYPMLTEEEIIDLVTAQKRKGE